jgi:hypothetical protein
MDQSCIVDVLEPRKKLRGNAAGLNDIEWALRSEKLLERRAVHVLHRHELLTFDLDQIEHAAHMRRGHIAGSAHLAPEKGDSLGIGADLGEKELQRDFHPELEIEGEPHFAHATPPEEAFDAIAITENLNRGRRGSLKSHWPARGSR